MPLLCHFHYCALVLVKLLRVMDGRLTAYVNRVSPVEHGRMLLLFDCFMRSACKPYPNLSFRKLLIRFMVTQVPNLWL